jgi:hypothetical protein
MMMMMMMVSMRTNPPGGEGQRLCVRHMLVAALIVEGRTQELARDARTQAVAAAGHRQRRRVRVPVRCWRPRGPRRRTQPPRGTVAVATDGRRGTRQGAAELVQRLEGHQDRVYAVSFHPTKPLLASCSADFTIKLWAARSPPSPARPPLYAVDFYL